ncbi:hypothetical protein SALBM135S_04260 [Streptomyces alboniger]
MSVLAMSSTRFRAVPNTSPWFRASSEPEPSPPRGGAGTGGRGANQDSAPGRGPDVLATAIATWCSLMFSRCDAWRISENAASASGRPYRSTSTPSASAILGRARTCTFRSWDACRCSSVA